ncbi:MAG: four helix bundle protein [Planctomycetota bacterium]|jgi:four helix bundle protein
MAFMFENLEVYQKAIDFAEQITSLTEQFPRGYYFLTDQLNRAALSIVTNIAEGNGRFTKADRKNFFVTARGSIQESVPLLELTRRRGLINEVTHNQSRDELETLAKMISGLIKGIDNRKE